LRIHGIISRRRAPTFSIGSSRSCAAGEEPGAPARFSSTKSFAYSPFLDAVQRLLHALAHALVDDLRPVTYSPYSALLEIE